jgi:phosphoglycerate kinase
MLTKKTIRDITNLQNKTVLVRVDFNVPINENGIIADDYRIRQALPTIEHLRGMGAKVVLISHMGRPTGPADAKYSLKPAAICLQGLLHLPVNFVDDCIGSKPKLAVKNMQPGDIILLENLRFYKAEEQNDKSFAKKLASLADVFVQDGFGVVHREHASTVAITQFLPSYAGVLLEKEVNTITAAMESPERPLAVIIGGAKISDKIDILKIFVEKADFVAVVGAMANTFLLAEGFSIGKSLAEKDAVGTAKQILKMAHEKTQKQRFTFYLPHDVVVAKSKDCISPTRVVDLATHTWADINTYPRQPKKQAYTVMEDDYILDIGPMTASLISGALRLAGTAIWNGTAGVTEVKGFHGAADPFSHGTKIITEGLTGERAGEKNHPFTVVGGGDTVGYVESAGSLRQRLGHVSTGGGASLNLMAGKKLPGIEALLSITTGNGSINA